MVQMLYLSVAFPLPSLSVHPPRPNDMTVGSNNALEPVGGRIINTKGGELPLAELPHRNPANKHLTTAVVQEMLRPFGITAAIRQLELYQRAFIHSSYRLTAELRRAAVSDPLFDSQQYLPEELAAYARAIPLAHCCNERLEFIGDSILSTCVGDYLFHRYPRQEEGFLTQLRIEIVKGTNLASLAKMMNWGQYLWLSRQVENRRWSDDDYLEDIFESLIGAVFYDFGGEQGEVSNRPIVLSPG